MTETDAIVVRGRHTPISVQFREHAQGKLGRVDRFGVHLQSIDVEVTEHSRGDHGFEVELTCIGRGPVIRAEALAADKYAAFDLALAKLEERLRRAGERRASRHRRATHDQANGKTMAVPADAEVAGADPADADVVYEDGPVVVREKSHPGAPMTVADALLAMELVGHDFYLFHDRDAGTPSVVYRRRAYDYGVLRLQL